MTALGTLPSTSFGPDDDDDDALSHASSYSLSAISSASRSVLSFAPSVQNPSAARPSRRGRKGRRGKKKKVSIKGDGGGKRAGGASDGRDSNMADQLANQVARNKELSYQIESLQEVSTKGEKMLGEKARGASPALPTEPPPRRRRLPRSRRTSASACSRFSWERSATRTAS